MTCHDISYDFFIDHPARSVHPLTIAVVAEHARAPAPPSPPPPPPLPLPPPSKPYLNFVPPVRHHRRTQLDRYRILVYFDDGQTVSEIAVRLQYSRNTVYRWIRAFFRNDGMVESKRRGRKRKLSPDVCETIVEHVKEVKFVTPREIKYFFDLDVCNHTIDRMLIEHGLFGRVARTRHPQMNPKKRLSFAHGTWEISRNVMTCHDVSRLTHWHNVLCLAGYTFDWSNVIFCDEACVWFGKKW